MHGLLLMHHTSSSGLTFLTYVTFAGRALSWTAFDGEKSIYNWCIHYKSYYRCTLSEHSYGFVLGNRLIHFGKMMIASSNVVRTSLGAAKVFLFGAFGGIRSKPKWPWAEEYLMEPQETVVLDWKQDVALQSESSENGDVSKLRATKIDQDEDDGTGAKSWQELMYR